MTRRFLLLPGAVLLATLLQHYPRRRNNPASRPRSISRRFVIRDTSGVDDTGVGTEWERKVMQRVGRTDLAIVSYSVAIPEAQTTTVPLVRLYSPRVYMPTHHDEVGGGRLDTPMEPLLLRLRDELKVRGVSPLYRTPVCFDTRTKAMFVGP